MQVLMIAGTIGKDAELRRTQAGEPVAGFSVAVDNGKDKSGIKRDPTWYQASLWGKRGEALAAYLTKGSRVAVTGHPQAREHDGKAYLNISVDQITLLGGGNHAGSSQAGTDGQQGGDVEDEIEF